MNQAPITASSARTTQTATQTEREIAAARALLKSTPVRLHHVPRWFAKRLKVYQRTFSGRKSPTSPTALVDEMCRQTSSGRMTRWLDHWGSTTFGKLDCFVSEPYGFDEDSAHALNELARATGLVWRVEANSWWYPGHTIRILIHEPVVNS